MWNCPAASSDAKNSPTDKNPAPYALASVSFYGKTNSYLNSSHSSQLGVPVREQTNWLCSPVGTMRVLRKLFFAVSRCLVLLHFSFPQVFDWALTLLHSGKWFLRKCESKTANAASRLRLYFPFTILEENKTKQKKQSIRRFSQKKSS